MKKEVEKNGCKKRTIKNINDFKDGLIVKFSQKEMNIKAKLLVEMRKIIVLKLRWGKKNHGINKEITIVSKYEPQKEVLEDKPVEDELVADSTDEPVSAEIEIGSKVKWTSKSGEELNGIVEKITKQSYKICCKPGKVSGEKGAVYLVEKTQVSLE